MKTYKDFIPQQEADNMLTFMQPLLNTLEVSARDNENGQPEALLHTEDFIRGAVLYSRLLTAIAGIQTLASVAGPLTAFYKLLKERRIPEALAVMREAERELHAAVMQRSAELADNIKLTEQHLRQYCKDTGTDPKDTPYA